MEDEFRKCERAAQPLELVDEDGLGVLGFIKRLTWTQIKTILRKKLGVLEGGKRIKQLFQSRCLLFSLLGT